MRQLNLMPETGERSLAKGVVKKATKATNYWFLRKN